MAVDGRKLRDTLRHGSDVYNEHPCSPCAKDNRNAEAIKYCVDCDENICGKCESDHKRFAVMRGHQIEDMPRTQAGQSRLDLPTTRCDKHGGKLVDVYCPSHDKVGCSTCVAVEHSTCQGIQYIPNVAKGIGTSKKLNDLEDELADLQKQIASLKLRKQANIKQLQEDKDKILKEMNALRKKINEHLDKMQKKLLEEVDILFDQQFKGTISVTKKVKDIESRADKIKKNLKDARNINDAELFVQFKDGSAYVKENANVLKDLGITEDERTMMFYASKELERLMSESTSLGHIAYRMRPKSALHFGDFDVSLTSDQKTCWITGVCLLDNGEIIIVDYANKRLKKLSSTFTVTELINLPDNPSGICEVDSQQLAVTLINTKKVQFVTPKVMKLGKSFTVGDRCRDIVRHDSSLYVCCGGSQKKHEGLGKIEVYSLTGELKRSFVDGLHNPLFLQSSISLNELIVSEYISESPYKSRLVAIDLQDHSVHEVKTDFLDLPLGFCMIGDDQLCVVGYRSNNLVLVSKDGQVQQELFREKNGFVNPWFVRFDEKQTRLIVTFKDTDTIKVFKLEM